MKQTVEEAAKESCLIDESIHNDMYQPYCVYDIKKDPVFQEKQSGWVSVKERLPEYNKRVIVLHKNRRIDTSIYHEDNNWSMFDSDIVAWMATPSFDEILETNKDVLTQFKDKGD